MVGVNYIAGSLNRSKKKTNAHAPGIASFANPTHAARVRGRPLFSRPPPIISDQPDRNGKRKRYIDTAHHPSGSSSIPDEDVPQRGGPIAYGVDSPGDGRKAAAGRSGIDGIDFPWAIQAREVYLEERRVDEMRRRNDAGLGEGDEEEAEAELRYMRSRVHEAKRKVDGEVRRGKRRWWNTFQGGEGGMSREIGLADEGSRRDRKRALSEELEEPHSEHAVRPEGDPDKQTVDQAVSPSTFDRERRIFVDLLREHDLLRIRNLDIPG